MTSKKKINSSTKTGFPVHEKANGKKIGLLPLINYHIGTGSMEITLEQINYHNSSKFLQIETEGHYPLNIDLLPHTGTILAFTEPPDALVILDDKKVGPSPQIIKDVRVGSHILELNHPDYLPITKKFDLKLDERKEFNLTLVTYEGSIQQEIDKLAFKRNVSVGAGVGFAALAATFKVMSNSAYSDYENATDPTEVVDFYEKAKNYNNQSALGFGAAVVALAPTIYFHMDISKMRQKLAGR